MNTLERHNIQTLKLLQDNGFTSAIIAGGAVRDAYFKRHPKDIDIFLHHPEYSSETFGEAFGSSNLKKIEVNETDLHQMLNLTNTDSIENACRGCIEEDEDYKEQRALSVDTVYNVYKDGFEYQIILLTRPPIEYVTQYFDLGICMAYCDGKRMRYTDRFMQDALNKTITVCGNLTCEEYKHTMTVRVPYMLQKFPGFTLQVDPYLVEQYGVK